MVVFRFPAFGANLNLAVEGEQIFNYRQICQRFRRGKRGCFKTDVNGLFASVPADAAFPRASSCNRDTRSDHPALSITNDSARFNTPVTTMADVPTAHPKKKKQKKMSYREKNPYDK